MTEITIMFAAILFISLVAFAWVWTQLRHVFKPNEILVVSGTNGERGYHVITSGRIVQIPIVQQVDRLDATSMAIEISESNVMTRDGASVDVRLVANTRIASQEPLVFNAVERYLGLTRDQIEAVARTTLAEGLRHIVASMTLEQIQTDRAALTDNLLTHDDLKSVGLVLDNLVIEDVKPTR